MFQSRWSEDVCVTVLEEVLSGDRGGGVLIEEAYRMETLGFEGLNVTLRFARGTRRLVCEEESWVRRGAGELVW